MFAACRRRCGELPKAALRLYSSNWDFLGNALLAAPDVENSASVQYVGSDHASISGIYCEDTIFLRIDFLGEGDWS